MPYVFLLFRYHMYNLSWILLIQGCFVPNLMEIVTVSGSGRRVSVNIFLYFVITSSSKRAGPSNVNSIHPMMLCVMFVWNWSSGSGKEEAHVKSLQTGGRTDEWQTTGDQNSSLDLLAQVLKSRYTQFKLVSIFFNTQRINKNNQHWIVLLYLFFQQHYIVCRNTWLLDKIECLSNV